MSGGKGILLSSVALSTFPLILFILKLLIRFLTHLPLIKRSRWFLFKAATANCDIHRDISFRSFKSFVFIVVYIIMYSIYHILMVLFGFLSNRTSWGDSQKLYILFNHRPLYIYIYIYTLWNLLLFPCKSMWRSSFFSKLFVVAFLQCLPGTFGEKKSK